MSMWVCCAYDVYVNECVLCVYACVWVCVVCMWIHVPFVAGAIKWVWDCYYLGKTAPRKVLDGSLGNVT